MFVPGGILTCYPELLRDTAFAFQALLGTPLWVLSPLAEFSPGVCVCGLFLSPYGYLGILAPNLLRRFPSQRDCVDSRPDSAFLQGGRVAAK